MVADEQIQKWADEAETGYDVEELKRRGVANQVEAPSRCRSWPYASPPKSPAALTVRTSSAA